MNAAERAARYRWVQKRPGSREAGKERPIRVDWECARCGYGPVGGRKRCPACMRPTGGGRGEP